jgi:fructokinase
VIRLPSIVTIGEILIDLTQVGSSPSGAPVYVAYPGGAPANVAVAAARLGADTAFVGKLGNDPFGEQLRRELQENGVDTSCLYTDHSAYTTVSIMRVDKRGDRSFHFFRSPGADTMLTQEEAMAGLTGHPKLFHFGSVALTAEPSKSAVLSAAAMAHRLGSLITFCPNYRASLWPSPADAAYNIQRVLPMCDIVRVTGSELALLTGVSDIDKGAEILANSYGILLVLVTVGANGVYYRYRGKSGHVPAVPCNAVDTNGAGDAFFGAVLSALCNEDLSQQLTISKLEEVIRFGTKVASITCSRHGAIPAMPTYEEVKNM